MLESLGRITTLTLAAFITLISWFAQKILLYFSPQRPVRRVAVLGGGIAGFGAAHSLCSSGTSVDLFEACKQVGGNAKTHEWPDGVVTGLSVLAWPSDYFRNYAALLHKLGLPTASVHLPFFIRRTEYRGGSRTHAMVCL